MEMGIDCLAMFESPLQIGIVLLIALLVFGPNKLPEIGRQIGSALRELRKATNDVVRSFNVDHEPDPDYSPGSGTDYGSSSYYNSYNSYNSYNPSPSVDLTDYTIVGQPVIEPAVAPQEPYQRPGILDDYAVLGAAASGSADVPAPGAEAKEKSDTVGSGGEQASA